MCRVCLLFAALPPYAVGYQTKSAEFQSTASEKFTMMAIPFRGIENEYVPVDDLKFTNIVPGGDQIGECDYIQIWNGTDLLSYYVYADDGEWYSDDGLRLLKEDFENGIIVGTPFWFVSYTKGTRPEGEVAPTFTVSGAVKPEGFRTYTPEYISTASEKFTMLSNPFPVAWLPGSEENGAVFTNLVPGGDQIGECDYIQVWNGSDLLSYYVYADDGEWYSDDGLRFLSEDFENGIPAGTPFWFVAWTKTARENEGGPTVTFYNPIAKK